MAFTTTTRLGLVKPTPGTNEPVDVEAQLNGNWDKVDTAIGPTICTSGTRPVTPYDGQLIRETDTRRVYIYNATQTTWEPILGPNAFYSLFLSLQPIAGGATAGVRVWGQGTAAGNRAMSFRGSGDTQDHFFFDYDGTMQWGSGTAGADVNLYRPTSGVARLKTDDSIEAALDVYSRGFKCFWGQTGETSISFTDVSAFSHTVTFPTAFATAPHVYANINSGAGSTSRWMARPISVTTTNFNCFVFSGNAANATWASVPVRWIAFGQ